MNHLVLIADIIGSKEIVQRRDFQQNFKTKIARINNHHKTKMVSPLTVTLGDEFQGVFSTAEGLFTLVHEIQVEFGEVRLRFAMGIGSIVTEINPEQAIGMDGPAFHRAREAMEFAKKKKRTFSYSGPENSAALTNQMLHWIGLTLDKWKQDRLAILLLKLQGLNQKEIAGKVSMTQPAVSQTLTQPRIKAVIESEQEIETYFNTMLAS